MLNYVQMEWYFECSQIRGYVCDGCFADVHTVGVYTMGIVVRHRLYGDACDVCRSETVDCIGRYRLHLGYEFGLWHE